MPNLAIRVSNVAKRYMIGAIQTRQDTLRDLIVDSFTAPFRRAASLVRGNGYGAAELGQEMWALRDISFEVQQGEVVGIIGRNGAGKSTLLKILSRITEPTRGRIELYGRVGALLEVGTGFHAELTGRENIYLNGAILGMSRAEINRKFDEIVDFSGIETFIDTPVKHYSSGMGLRLGFAVAAHLEPEILIVDEVLAVGDAEFQKKCLGKMSEVAGEGRTVLFVSHNMAAVRTLCTRAVILHQGQVIADGEVDETINQYLMSSLSQSTASVELPPGTDSVSVRPLRLSFETADGEPAFMFKVGDPWKVTLTAEVKHPSPQVMMAVGLVSLEGISLLTIWSKPRDLEPGVYSTTFEIDVPFSAMDILFNVGISSYGRTLVYLPQQGRVTISEISATAKPFRSRGAGLLIPVDAPDIRCVEMSAGAAEALVDRG